MAGIKMEFHKGAEAPLNSLCAIVGEVMRPGAVLLKGNNLPSRWRDVVVFTPQGIHELMEVFKYGDEHPRNIWEQQAGLFGRIFRETADGKTRHIVVVEYVIEALTSMRNSIGAAVDPDMKRRLMDERDVINRNLPANALKVEFLGFAHSHPGNLAVFMSGTDTESHRRAFAHGNRYGVSVVLNPQRRVIKAYGGNDAGQIDLLAIAQRQDALRFGEALCKTDNGSAKESTAESLIVHETDLEKAMPDTAASVPSNPGAVKIVYSTHNKGKKNIVTIRYETYPISVNQQGRAARLMGTMSKAGSRPHFPFHFEWNA